MKSQKQSRIGGLILLSVSFAGQALLAAEPSDVQLPAKRAEALETATKIQSVREIATTIPNPFYPPAFVGTAPQATRSSEQTVATPAGPRGDKALLQAIAANLKPSGYFVLGGHQTLVFGQKRVRAGGVLNVTFEGSEYILEITAIDRTHFTLRLNREEFTRPIK